MPQPVSYNTGTPVSGSIQENSISYVVDGQQRDYRGGFGGLSWMSEVPAENNVIFIGNTTSIGRGPAGKPLFYPSYNNTEANIVYAANTLPGSPRNFTTSASAYNWAVTNNFFINNSDNPIPRIDADGLVLYLDARQASSYPQTGTSWYDLSGVGNNGALRNSPSWNSNGWFTFDGIDDYVQISNDASLRPANELTIEMVVRAVATTGGWNLLYGQNPYTGGQLVFLETGGTLIRALHYVNGTEYRCNTNESISTTVFKHVIFTFKTGDAIRSYFNGTPSTTVSLPAGTFTYNTSNPYYLSYYGANIPNIQYNTVKSYNTALTEAQVKQNYFQSNIVTDGLVFMTDASNLVSYPKSGTAWYNLTGSITSGLLTNGPTFNPANGGSIVFDGTNDYVNFGSSGVDFGTGNFNVSCWIKTSDIGTGDWAGVVSKYDTGASTGLWIQLSPINRYVGFGWDGSTYLTSTTSVSNGQWRHISCQRTGASTAEIYVDGVLVASGAGANKNSNSATQLDIGRIAISGRYFNGNIANTKLYNKALSAAEILQNYEATKDKFQGQQIVTNGLVLNLDAADKDSYPGTGTTWTDLSGNNYNATVESSVSFNSTYGGGLTTLNNAINANQSIYGTFSLSSANYTWEIWYTNNGSQGGDASGFGVTDASGVSSNGFRANSNSSVQQWVGGSLTVGQTISTASTPKQVVLRRSGTTFNSFSNGVLIDTDTAASTSGTFVNYSMNCRGCTSSNNGWNGTYYIVRMYNRALSDAEILQNFNAQKSRFGL